MTKWIIKHYNAITLCLAIVTLYLFVQFFRHSMELKPLLWVLSWCLVNTYANRFMSYRMEKPMHIALELTRSDSDNYDVHNKEYESLSSTQGKFDYVSLAYAIASFILCLSGYLGSN